jgi:hypothetical protein
VRIRGTLQSINPHKLNSPSSGGPVSCEHYADGTGSCQSTREELLPRIYAVGPFSEWTQTKEVIITHTPQDRCQSLAMAAEGS